MKRDDKTDQPVPAITSMDTALEALCYLQRRVAEDGFVSCGDADLEKKFMDDLSGDI
ncbi:hypothetical protein [Haematobacter missouriensis]|jgi:hypothetical protein|uniref:hypothetical protein n=1 Tax=Haematobacter missouriensis TaxID=366616 RepID=UPI0012EC5C6C|nr:hypothetical protein [Haematobacter missouriensis]